MRGVAGARRLKPFKLTPPEPKEDALQQSIADLLDFILPEDKAVWSHFPAGGYFLTPAARGRLYRLGLKPGFPDICICFGDGRTLWLEVKTASGHLSFSQRRMHRYLHLLGHAVVVCRSIEQVIAALDLHGVPYLRARLAKEFRHGSNEGTASRSAA